MPSPRLTTAQPSRTRPMRMINGMFVCLTPWSMSMPVSSGMNVSMMDSRMTHSGVR